MRAKCDEEASVACFEHPEVCSRSFTHEHCYMQEVVSYSVLGLHTWIKLFVCSVLVVCCACCAAALHHGSIGSLFYLARASGSPCFGSASFAQY